MKPLVIQFQEDLTVGNKGIADLLRTAKLISAKLGLGTIQEWIEHELNGYPLDLAILPDYRVISGGQLQFCNPYHGWIPAMASPIVDIPIRGAVTKLAVYKPGDHFYVSPAVNYPLTDPSGSSQPIMSFPQRIEFSVSAIIGIVEGVKTRLVDWSIELEKQGILGENMSFKEEEKAIAKNQTSTNIFNVKGDFSRVNFRSLDNSVNIQDRSGTVFDAAREKLHAEIEDEDVLKELLAHLQLMEDAKSKPNWATAYSKFVECAANHMTIIAPLLPLLAETAKNAF
jgi:hypothetical protein